MKPKIPDSSDSSKSPIFRIPQDIDDAVTHPAIQIISNSKNQNHEQARIGNSEQAANREVSIDSGGNRNSETLQNQNGGNSGSSSTRSNRRERQNKRPDSERKKSADSYAETIHSLCKQTERLRRATGRRKGLTQPESGISGKRGSGTLETTNLGEFGVGLDRDLVLAPIESNGAKLDKKLLGIDYLVINCRTEFDFASIWKNDDSFSQVGSLTLQSMHATRQFSKNFKVFVDDRHVASILTTPWSPAIENESVMLEILNEQLYVNKGDQLYDLISTIMVTLDLQYHNISRLDIYIDFQRFNETTKYEDLIKNILDGTIHNVGRVAPFKPVFRGNLIEGFSFGTRSSYKYLRCYNKSFELAKRYKPYVVDLWKKTGFRRDTQVYRMEVELKSKFFNQIEDPLFSLIDIFRNHGLVNLLRLAIDGWFEWVYNDGTKRNDRKKHFKLIDLSQFGELGHYAYDYCFKRLKSVPKKINAIRNAIRHNIREYVNNHQSEYFLRASLLLASKYDMVWMLQKRIYYWLEEFLDERPAFYPFSKQKYDVQLSLIIKEGFENESINKSVKQVSQLSLV